MYPTVRFSTHADPAHPSELAWLLWVEENGQSNGRDRLWAGRVKLQDDPIATAHAVLDAAREKLEISLVRWETRPLF